MKIDESEVRERARSVLARHPVTFAMVFGSTARDDAVEPSDVDLAVEFDEPVRDAGYSDAYLELVADLEATLGVDVDVVPVSSLGPRFAAVAFEEGVVVLGTEERRDELARSFAGDLPSTAEASERVAAAAARLADGSD